MATYYAAGIAGEAAGKIIQHPMGLPTPLDEIWRGTSQRRHQQCVHHCQRCGHTLASSVLPCRHFRLPALGRRRSHSLPESPGSILLRVMLSASEHSPRLVLWCRSLNTAGTRPACSASSSTGQLESRGESDATVGTVLTILPSLQNETSTQVSPCAMSRRCGATSPSCCKGIYEAELGLGGSTARRKCSGKFRLPITGARCPRAVP